MFNFKNEGKMKLHQTSSAQKSSQNQRRQQFVFHSCLKTFSVLQVCDHCKPFHGTQIFLVPAMWRAILSNHTFYLLKYSVKSQKKFYLSYTIWRVQLRLFENIEAEEICSASSVFFYVKHHSMQISSKNYLKSEENLQEVCPGVIALEILLIMKSGSKSVRFRSGIITFFFNL